MFVRRKWLLPLLALLSILFLILVPVFIRNANSEQAITKVPLSGQRSTPLPAFNKTDIILAFTKSISPQQRAAIEGTVKAREIRSLGVDNAYLVTVPGGHILAAAQILKAQPDVKYAEPDYTQTVTAVPNDPGFSTQWAFQNTGQTVNGTAGTAGDDDDVTAAWNVTTGSSTIVIGEVDTGVDYTHPDLAANIWNNPGSIGGCAAGTHGYNVLNSTCNPMDDDQVYGGHGTHVAGILGARGNNGVGVTGVNWHTTILPVKWVTANGSGATSDLITALNWLLSAKQAGVNIRVINDSTVFVGTAYSQALSDEIDLLGQNGILFVTAAGNTGQNNDNPSYRRYPCGYDRPTEICVAASDQNDNLPSWANYGPHTVDLAAPGNNIYSTLPHNNYGFINGSSMASPQVAGAAALILSVQNMTPVQLKADILNNVDQVPSLSGLLITGGVLDICRALPGCVPPTPTPTPGSTPTLTPTPMPSGQTSITVDTDTDFNQGTYNGTAVSGTGPSAVLQLATAATGPSGTQYKRAITISNTGNSNTLTNYQISFTLNTTSLISSGKMRSNCGDIRINDSDDATAIPNYWVENCNNTATTIWVKVPSISASSTKTIYLYYGSSSATSLSSVLNTFIRDIPNVAAAWPMNESSGSFVADTTGDGHNGSATTTVGIVTGKFGNARSFNGSQGYIQVAGESTLPFGKSARTVCAWVTTNSLSGTAVIFDTGTTTTDQFFAIGRSGSSLAAFGWNDDLSVPNFFSTGVWYDVCLSYDGTTATLYGNGVQLAQAAKAWNTVDSGGTFIGNDYSNHVWNGSIEAVSYYSRALSAAEISDLANNYGYTTGNYQGHQLVESYSSPAPTATVGNELASYVPSGTWQSAAFSLGNNLGWGDGTTGSSTAFTATVLNVSSTATIQFQIRTATSAAGLASASYISLGTATGGTSFTLTKAQLDALGVPTGSGEYIQVEVVLTNTGANTNTPQLNNFTVSYKSS